MKNFIFILIALSLGNIVLAYELLELSDLIKQAREDVKMAQLKSMNENYIKENNKNVNINEKSACETINTKEISTAKQ